MAIAIKTVDLRQQLTDKITSLWFWQSWLKSRKKSSGKHNYRLLCDVFVETISHEHKCQLCYHQFTTIYIYLPPYIFSDVVRIQNWRVWKIFRPPGKTHGFQEKIVFSQTDMSRKTFMGKFGYFFIISDNVSIWWPKKSDKSEFL